MRHVTIKKEKKVKHSLRIHPKIQLVTITIEREKKVKYIINLVTIIRDNLFP